MNKISESVAKLEKNTSKQQQNIEQIVRTGLNTFETRIDGFLKERENEINANIKAHNRVTVEKVSQDYQEIQAQVASLRLKTNWTFSIGMTAGILACLLSIKILTWTNFIHVTPLVENSWVSCKETTPNGSHCRVRD